MQRLESALGVSSPSGSLSLGSVVFEPAALRVTAVPGSLGGPAAGPVLTATSDRHVVTIALDAARQARGQGGGRGDGHAAGRVQHAGQVSSVGTVASGVRPATRRSR